MFKPLPVVIFLSAIVFINRVDCNKLTRVNVVTLGGEYGYLEGKQISEIDPAALEVIQWTNLNLNDNELTFLQEDLFQYKTNFEYLFFPANKISEIHPLVFQNLPNITKIELQFNELTEIPESLFEGNTKLTRLSLYQNRITFFHPNTFRSLKELEVLNVESNRLATFDFNLLSSSKELEDLYLRDNNLTEFRFHGLKSCFPKFSFVTFSGNKFNCSFADQITDYIAAFRTDRKISCIGDEEYAAIVRDRQINTPVSSQCTNMQLHSEEQCNEITLELKNDNAKMKGEIAEMTNVIEGLKLQLLEKQSVTVEGKSDCKNVKVDIRNVVKSLKLQLLEQQSVIDELQFLTEPCSDKTVQQ